MVDGQYVDGFLIQYAAALTSSAHVEPLVHSWCEGKWKISWRVYVQSVMDSQKASAAYHYIIYLYCYVGSCLL